jgi:hypothetical protein
LAAAFPGRKSLVELIDNQSRLLSAQPDDPFASDPGLLPDDGVLMSSGDDPFADDPGFGIEVDLVTPGDAAGPDASMGSELIDDPFAADESFDAVLSDDKTITSIGGSEVNTEENSAGLPQTDLPFDPFAEDSFGFDETQELIEIDTEKETSPVSAVSELVAAIPNDAIEDPFADDDDFIPEEIPESSVVSPAVMDDPFAADDSLSDTPLDVPAAATENRGEDSVTDPFAEDSFDLGIEELPTVDSASLSGNQEPAPSELKALPGDATVDAGDAPETEAADVNQAANESITDRAEAIAESLLLPQQEAEPRQEYVCCVFAIGGRDYYLPIEQMLEIADLPQLIPLPLAPPMVSGLINLRGQVMPAINLAALNQHHQDEVRIQRRLVIAEYQGESLAFLADGIPYLSENFSGEKIDMKKFISLYRIRGDEA